MFLILCHCAFIFMSFILLLFSFISYFYINFLFVFHCFAWLFHKINMFLWPATNNTLGSGRFNLIFPEPMPFHGWRRSVLFVAGRCFFVAVLALIVIPSQTGADRPQRNSRGGTYLISILGNRPQAGSEPKCFLWPVCQKCFGVAGHKQTDSNKSKKVNPIKHKYTNNNKIWN